MCVEFQTGELFWGHSQLIKAKVYFQNYIMYVHIDRHARI